MRVELRNIGAGTAVLVLLVAACAKAPLQEIEAKKQQVRVAIQKSEAQVYAPESVRAVQDSLAAIDASGQVTDWKPVVEGAPADPGTGTGGSAGAVYALAVMSGTVYVGGDFVRVGGLDRRHLAAVDASGLRHNELWSYDISGGRLRPVRYGTSSDVQLWSCTDLAVQFALSRLPRP